MDVKSNVVVPAALPLPALPQFHEHDNDNKSNEDVDMAIVKPPSKQPRSESSDPRPKSTLDEFFGDVFILELSQGKVYGKGWKMR